MRCDHRERGGSSGSGEATIRRRQRGQLRTARLGPTSRRKVMAVTLTQRWPSILVADWQETRDTLQLYTQVVGKVRLANEPCSNHWWNVPLYVTARGLTTSLMPHRTGPAFQVD